MEWLVSRIDGHSTGARSVQRLVEATVSRTIGEAFLNGNLESGKSYEFVVRGTEGLGIVARVTS